MLASVVRSINDMKGYSGTMSKDLVISIGEFVYNQLVGLDEISNHDEKFATLSILLSLRLPPTREPKCKMRLT